MEKTKIHALIDNVPRVPDITDDYVVNLMQNELAKLKNRGININPKSGLDPTRDINKVFLANTIKNVTSHNRREQVNQCWRQIDLKKSVHKRTRIQSLENSSMSLDEADREYWAARKAANAYAVMEKEETKTILLSDFVPEGRSKKDEDKDKEKDKKKKKKSSKKKEKKERKKTKKHRKDNKEELGKANEYDVDSVASSSGNSSYSSYSIRSLKK